MICTELLKVNGKAVQGLKIVAPGGEGHPNLLILLCEKGFVMCGYLDIAKSASFGDAACIGGGASFEDMLKNPIKAVTPEAEELGVKVGMTGEEACAVLS